MTSKKNDQTDLAALKKKNTIEVQGNIRVQKQNNIQFLLLSDNVIKKIFQFLNVIDICIITLVCKKWKKLIEKDPDTFNIVNLTVIGTKVNTLNLMKVVQSDKNIIKLYLPYHTSQTDTNYLLMCIPETLEYLQINNINLEFANLFSHPITYLKTLDLQNKQKRKKEFDENEIKAMYKFLPNLENILINKAPVSDETMIRLLPNYTQLKTLALSNCLNLTNQSLSYIAKYCVQLTQLEVGGSPTNYNQNYSYEGFTTFKQAKFQLESIKIEYCSRVGDKVIQLLATIFNTRLRTLSIIRNCYEKCSKISDEGIASLRLCPNLERLNITYTRKFREEFHQHIACNLHNLRYLGVKDCPLYEDLSIFAVGCPFLEEVDLSGDSWQFYNINSIRVTVALINGLSKHAYLKILHLGHFEHGDSQCDLNLEEFPPKGLFLEDLFDNERRKQDNKHETFPKLHLLYLEQNCSLTYWLDVKLQKIRPKLTIRYTPAEDLFGGEK